MAFTCPRCGRTSQHPGDEREGYCGACRDWTGSPVVASRLAIEAVPGLAIPVRQAQDGRVVYLTEGGQPAAEIHPAGTAARLEALGAGE